MPDVALPVRAVVLASILAASVGCAPQPPPLDPQGQAVVRAWLTCDECVDGERARVDSLGSAAVRTLSGSLFDLSGQLTANMRAQYSRLYAMLPSPGIDSATFVDRYLGTLSATVSRRAVVSLGDLEAWSALEEAADLAASRGDAVLETLLRGQLRRDPSRSVLGAGVADSWDIVAPATDSEVCNGEGPTACTSTTSATIIGRASGPSGTFANPWTRVYFYAAPLSSTDPPDLVGELPGAAAVITDDGTHRHYEWNFVFGPGGWPLGRLRVLAVAVDASDNAFRTPQDSLLSVVVGR